MHQLQGRNEGEHGGLKREERYKKAGQQCHYAGEQRKGNFTIKHSITTRSILTYSEHRRDKK